MGGRTAGGAGRRAGLGRPRLPGSCAVARGQHVWARARERRSRASHAAETGGAPRATSTRRSRRTSAGGKLTGGLAGPPRDSWAGPGTAGAMVRAGHAGTSGTRAATGGDGRAPQQASRRLALVGEQDAAASVRGQRQLRRVASTGADGRRARRAYSGRLGRPRTPGPGAGKTAARAGARVGRGPKLGPRLQRRRRQGRRGRKTARGRQFRRSGSSRLPTDASGAVRLHGHALIVLRLRSVHAGRGARRGWACRSAGTGRRARSSGARSTPRAQPAVGRGDS